MSTTIAGNQATTAAVAVRFTKLIEFLPVAPTEREGEEPVGLMQSYEGGTWSVVTKSYSQLGTEDVTADVGITVCIIYYWVKRRASRLYSQVEGYLQYGIL